MKLRFRFIVLLLALTSTQVCLAGGGMRPERAEHGMVANVHELASQAGVEMLKGGGNAIDAAVATGFVLAVVHPAAGNIGNGFMLIRMDDGQTHFLDYREKAPGKATADMYQDADGNVIPKLSRVGYLAAGVPGSVKGIVHAQFLGDPEFSDVPVMRLTDKKYAVDWRNSINPQRASSSARPETAAELTRYATEHPVIAPGKEPTQTPHYSVVDAEGNAVAVTSTINGGYGSKVTVGPLGFCSTTRWTISVPRPACPTCSGSSRTTRTPWARTSVRSPR